MEGIRPTAASRPASHRFGWPSWAEFVWFGYLAWALPYFFAKYWPVIQGWAGGRGR